MKTSSIAAMIRSAVAWATRYRAYPAGALAHSRCCWLAPLPYVATTSPIVEQLVAADPDTDRAQVLWWALAIGADLGGNATAVGASANVVVLGIASRAGRPISFWQFTRYGLVVALVSVALAVPYLWLRFFVGQ